MYKGRIVKNEMLGYFRISLVDMELIHYPFLGGCFK